MALQTVYSKLVHMDCTANCVFNNSMDGTHQRFKEVTKQLKYLTLMQLK